MRKSKAPIIYSYVGGITIGSGISALTDNVAAGALIGIGIAFLWVSLALKNIQD